MAVHIANLRVMADSDGKIANGKIGDLGSCDRWTLMPARRHSLIGHH